MVVKLIERLGTVPPNPNPNPEFPVPYTPSGYPNMMVYPKDSDFISSDSDIQKTITTNIIRNQSDYVVITDPSNFLHSAMQNPFYNALTEVIQTEWKNVMDKVNSLKTLLDIDYYDGDQEFFEYKINSLLKLLVANVPIFFSDYINVENGDIFDITKKNDFLRCLVKKIWLQRRWAGTYYGYSLPFKIIERLGAIHIGSQYIGSTLSLNTGKVFRFLDMNKFELLVPGSSLSLYPLSSHLPSLKSISSVKSPYYKWDMGYTWDQQLPVTFSIDAGVTGISFSPIVTADPITFTFSVISILGAVPGTITIAGQEIDIVADDLLGENILAARIAAEIIPDWTISVTPPGSSNLEAVFDTAAIKTLQWDKTIPLNISGKRLLFELSLDRLLTHTNSIGTNICLLENVFCEAINTFLPNIQRVQDNIMVGSQLSLVTSNDGYFNTLSGESYSHPNINAKFQVFKYKTDLETLNWTYGADVDYIKIGSGGYGDTDVDDYVFVPSTAHPDDPDRVVLTNLKEPLYKTYIGANERDKFGDYYVINSVIHPQTISQSQSVVNLLLNGIYNPIEFSITVPTTTGAGNLIICGTVINFGSGYTASSLANQIQFMVNVNISGYASYVSHDTVVCIYSTQIGKSSPTIVIPGVGGITGATISNGVTFDKTYCSYIKLVHSYISEGTVSVAVNIDHNIPTVVIEDGWEGADLTGVVFSSVTEDTTHLSSFSCTSVAGAIPGFITIAGVPVELIAGNITSKQAVIAKIYSCRYDFYDFTISLDPTDSTKIKFASKTEEIHQKIMVYEQYNPLKGVYDTYFKYQQYDATTGKYFDYKNEIQLDDYTYDSSYYNAIINNDTTKASYFPTVQKNPLTLEPLVQYDKYPSLYDGLVARYTFDENNATSFKDYSVNLTTGIRNDNKGIANNVSVVAGLVHWAYSFNGTSSYASVINSSSIVSMPKFAISFVMNAYSTSQTLGVLFAKQSATPTYGWGLYYTWTTGATGTLTFRVEKTIQDGIWTANYPHAGNTNHFVVVDYRGTGNPTIYIDSISVPVTENQAPDGISIADSGSSLYIGGFAASNFFKGSISEISIYNRNLLQGEVKDIYEITENRDVPLLSSTNEQLYVYINHKNGTVSLRPKYNNIGPLSTTTGALSQYSVSSFIAVESYKLNIQKQSAIIRELGLFDAEDNMVAYATFPPIIYDSSKYHLGLNLLIKGG